MPSQSAGRADDFDLPPDEVGPYEPDIATTIHGERMNVDVPGRRRFGRPTNILNRTGEDSGEYNPRGSSRNKGRQSEQAARGVLDRKPKCNASLYPDQRFNADRLYSPQYNDSGETAFFHDKKDEPLSDEAMSSLVTEFKKASPTHTDLN
ncbi:hypothetical protein F25303_9897 [Fusarium sp. NRRL 25303]|nr:hypothetical protein F25303_9897 [Fusarium sp. NRRL 25303]